MLNQKPKKFQRSNTSPRVHTRAVAPRSNRTNHTSVTPTPSTSWGSVASWYDEYLQDADTYQAKVIAPNLLRILDVKKFSNTTRVLDLGCGQGYFVKQILEVSHPQIEGVDVGDELISLAKKHIGDKAVFTKTSASNLSHIKDHSVDIVYSVLALQNMADLEKVIQESVRVLSKKGRMVFVLNHPAFRIPKQSDWYTSSERKAQGRVVYTYMSDKKFTIDMNPGKKAAGLGSEETYSFHHPLQYYGKLFQKYNLGISRIEEWISHKKSEEGPKKYMEDEARKEIPMFMCLEVRSFIE